MNAPEYFAKIAVTRKPKPLGMPRKRAEKRASFIAPVHIQIYSFHPLVLLEEV